MPPEYGMARLGALSAHPPSVDRGCKRGLRCCEAAPDNGAQAEYVRKAALSATGVAEISGVSFPEGEWIAANGS